MLNGQKVNIRLMADFPVIPVDKYTCQLTDCNLKTKVFNGVEEEGINYELTILDNKSMDVNGQPESLRGRKLWYWGSTKLSARSNLGKLVFAAYKKELSKVEMEKFQPEDIINMQVAVFVELVDGKGENAGRQFNNVVSVMKVDKDLTPLPNEKSQVGGETTTKSVAEIEANSKKDEVKVEEAVGEEDFIGGLEADKAKEESK